MVLLLFLKNKNLRSPANYLVANLAFSDMCMMISQFPFFAYNCFSGGVWMFSAFFCELYACLGKSPHAIKALHSLSIILTLFLPITSWSLTFVSLLKLSSVLQCPRNRLLCPL